MKILFVCSGNRLGISPIIKNQADSINKLGVGVDFYTIQGKGVKGYLRNVIPLRRVIKKGAYDIVHAHYSLSAFVASFAVGRSPLVVSLMGSDVKASNWYKFIIKLFAMVFSWKSIVVKSKDMYSDLGIKLAHIIPNGVDMERFAPKLQQECCWQLGWDRNKKHLLFPANLYRREKNAYLTQKAIGLITTQNIELHYFENVPNEQTPIWYNAADVICMTSLWEGSPNAIKESMACNRTIVTTDVGDVRWVIGDTEGCYICSYDPHDCAEKIKQALAFSETIGSTNGRKRIKELGLDNKLVAQKLIEIYKKVTTRKKMDFTLNKYKDLLLALKDIGVEFITYSDYCENRAKNGNQQKIILRHDVDLLPFRSRDVAKIECELGIVATYYFRIVPESYNEELIKEIASLGHEIGYHYEDLVIMNGDIDKAFIHFKEKLSLLRNFYPVSTICMHGSPKSSIDPKDLWTKYNYRELGISGEPYFDTNWDEVFYLTDTGRRWDGFKVSRRDKIETHQPAWNKRGLIAHTTNEVIELFMIDKLSAYKAVMITTHPQRWTDSKSYWAKELFLQNIKNLIKRMMKLPL